MVNVFNKSLNPLDVSGVLSVIGVMCSLGPSGWRLNTLPSI